MRRILRLPDIFGLFAGQLVALTAGIIAVPVGYIFPVRRSRLGTRGAKLGWAVVDGYRIWLLVGFVSLGLWCAPFIGSVAIRLLVVLGLFFAGTLISEKSAPALARSLMRRLGA